MSKKFEARINLPNDGYSLVVRQYSDSPAYVDLVNSFEETLVSWEYDEARVTFDTLIAVLDALDSTPVEVEGDTE